MRTLQREIRQGIRATPVLRSTLVAAGVVGRFLLRPARRLRYVPESDQPTLAEYLAGGRQPELRF